MSSQRPNRGAEGTVSSHLFCYKPRTNALPEAHLGPGGQICRNRIQPSISRTYTAAEQGTGWRNHGGGLPHRSSQPLTAMVAPRGNNRAQGQRSRRVATDRRAASAWFLTPSPLFCFGIWPCGSLAIVKRIGLPGLSGWRWQSRPSQALKFACRQLLRKAHGPGCVVIVAELRSVR